MKSARSASPLATMIRRAGLPAGAAIVMGFFVYYALLGPNGILAYRDYSRQLEKRQAQYDALDKQRAQLKNRVDQMDPRHANPDLVDEMARKRLNVVHPDEVIVPLNQTR